MPYHEFIIKPVSCGGSSPASCVGVRARARARARVRVGVRLIIMVRVRVRVWACAWGSSQ